jgi:hypothetical protein
MKHLAIAFLACGIKENLDIWVQWFKHVIPARREVEIGRITEGAQSGQKVSKTPSQSWV